MSRYKVFELQEKVIWLLASIDCRDSYEERVALPF